MAKSHIEAYRNVKSTLIKFGNTRNESSLKGAFIELINHYASEKGLRLIPEERFSQTAIPDGTLRDALKLDHGYWESKDEKDDIEEEIKLKIKRGYPLINTIFEDSNIVILYRNGERIKSTTTKVEDSEALHLLLSDFVGYERPEVKTFRAAILRFSEDIGPVTEGLKEMISNAEMKNVDFRNARMNFLAIARESINTEVSEADVNEMLMQHILTEDIFLSVFNESIFHEENNIASELRKLEKTFFTGNTKRETVQKIQPYYEVIKAEASRIANNSHKQEFLKTVYENFYKYYNPKAADRLGVVYTPEEIVQFMVKATDNLLHKYFNKSLGAKGVEILDPATGTGTFITALINYLDIKEVDYKYKEELHCNEISILPYYIANLNIEATFKEKTGKYLAFENICFMDTLENNGFDVKNKQNQLTFGISAENSARVKRQNSKKISVIIGNPPYNANQQNENENNKNKQYPQLDKRIKDTFIFYSKAQKTKVYDMYSRFYRWAMDRLDKNGIIAFVTNRSFIDSSSFDGFRKSLRNDFSQIYILDTKSDVRDNPKISGTANNVFSIQTGVAITFLIKNEKDENTLAEIFYYALEDEMLRNDKLNWLKLKEFNNIPFFQIVPDAQNNWLNLTINDFNSGLPLVSKNSKLNNIGESTLFKTFSLGVVTARDEWVYDFSELKLKEKLTFFIEYYNKITIKEIEQGSEFKVKISRLSKKNINSGTKYDYSSIYNKNTIYRPFIRKTLYFYRSLNEEQYQWPRIINEKYSNLFLCFSGLASNKSFQVLITNCIVGHDTLEKTQCVPLYRFIEDKRVDNITKDGLNNFRYKYGNQKISGEDIFKYCYAVLHNPEYRNKYKQNLKRDFPRIPFYENFDKWKALGEELMDLHLNFETVEAYPGLEIINNINETVNVGRSKDSKLHIKNKTQQLEEGTRIIEEKPLLKADKVNGIVQLTTLCSIRNIPALTWEYQLGIRSAVEWILDQYKEKKPKDETIREKFNTYKFMDYKDKVLDLIPRIVTVSVRTVEIMKEMVELNSKNHKV